MCSSPYKCRLLSFTCVWFFCEGISNNIKKMALYDEEVEEVVTIVMFERLFPLLHQQVPSIQLN